MVRIRTSPIRNVNANTSGFTAGLQLSTPQPKATDAFRIAIADLIRQEQMKQLFAQQTNLLEKRLDDLWQRSQAGTAITLAARDPMANQVKDIISRKFTSNTPLEERFAFLEIAPQYSPEQLYKAINSLQSGKFFTGSVEDIQTLQQLPPQSIANVFQIIKSEMESEKKGKFNFSPDKYALATNNIQAILQSRGLTQSGTGSGKSFLKDILEAASKTFRATKEE